MGWPQAVIAHIRLSRADLGNRNRCSDRHSGRSNRVILRRHSAAAHAGGREHQHTLNCKSYATQVNHNLPIHPLVLAAHRTWRQKLWRLKILIAKMAGNNNVHRGPQRDKPFRDALRMVQADLDNGSDREYPPGSLRWNAKKLLMLGEVPSIREIADRLDGKVPQAVVGDSEYDPVQHTISGLLAEIDGKTRGLGKKP